MTAEATTRHSSPTVLIIPEFLDYGAWQAKLAASL
jgi:hypothetical protein